MLTDCMWCRSVATSPANANGELGLYSICPNTQIFAENDVLQFLNVTELNTACLYVDYNCNIKIVRAVYVSDHTSQLDSHLICMQQRRALLWPNSRRPALLP